MEQPKELALLMETQRACAAVVTMERSSMDKPTEGLAFPREHAHGRESGQYEPLAQSREQASLLTSCAKPRWSPRDREGRGTSYAS
jgi:hypothetical protein